MFEVVGFDHHDVIGRLLNNPALNAWGLTEDFREVRHIILAMGVSRVGPGLIPAAVVIQPSQQRLAI